MSQVHLRPLFNASPTTDPDPASEPAPARTEPLHQHRSAQRVQLDTPEWANVAFVVAACAGAIFSVAFLFRAGALLQEVAAWPRELFTGRPVSLVEAAAKHSPTNESGAATNSSSASVLSPNDSGDPFSSAEKLLGLDRSSPTRPRAHNNSLFATPLLASPASSPSVTAESPHANPVFHNLPGDDAQLGQAFPAAAATGTSAAQAVAARSAVAASSASNKAAAQTAVRAGTRAARVANHGRSPLANSTGLERTSKFKSAMRSLVKSLGFSTTEHHTAVQTRALSTHARSAAHAKKQNATSRRAVPPNGAQSRVGREKARANLNRRTAKTAHANKASSLIRNKTRAPASVLRVKKTASANPSFTGSASQSPASVRNGGRFGVGPSIGNLGGAAMGVGLGHGGGRGR